MVQCQYTHLIFYCVGFQVKQSWSYKQGQIADSQEPYELKFQIVYLGCIRSQGRFMQDHIHSRTGCRSCRYNLCKECKHYLEDWDDDLKNIWPLFLYSVLLRGSQCTFVEKAHHYAICGAETLWRLIPESIRPCWKDEIAKYYAFDACPIVTLAAVFEDKTLDFFVLKQWLQLRATYYDMWGKVQQS